MKGMSISRSAWARMPATRAWQFIMVRPAQALFLPDGVEQGRFGQAQGLGDALGGGGAHGLALAQPGQADPAAVRAGDTGGEPPAGHLLPQAGVGAAVSLSTRASGWARDS